MVAEHSNRQPHEFQAASLIFRHRQQSRGRIFQVDQLFSIRPPENGDDTEHAHHIGQKRRPLGRRPSAKPVQMLPPRQ